MSIYQRTFLFLKRNYIKTFLLFIIIFILGNVVVSCFEIKNAVTQLESSIKNDLTAAASIEFDPNNILPVSDTDEQNYQFLTESLFHTIGERAEVKSYNFTYNFSLWSDAVRRTDESTFMAENQSLFPINLFGIENLEAMDFEKNVGKIVEGRQIEPNELKQGAPVLVVSKEFAEYNKLKLGDMISARNLVKDINENTGKSEWLAFPDLAFEDYELEIIGVYQTNLLIEPIGFKYSKEKNINDGRKNMLFTSNELIRKMAKFYDEVNHAHGIASNANSPKSAVYILDDHANLSNFKENVQTIIPENYVVTLTTDSYDKISTPFQKLNTFATILFIIGSMLAIIIFFFIIKMNIQERFTEFGIFLSVGIKRIQIISQVCIEVFLITLLALSLSIFTGGFLASQIAESQLAKYSFVSEEEKILEGLEENNNNLESTGFAKSLDITQVINDFSINITFLQGILLISSIFLLVFIVCVFALRKIYKLNPKDILLK